MDTPTKQTLGDLSKRIKIESEYGKVPAAHLENEWQKKAHNYRVTLRYQRRRITIDFFMGEAITDAPTVDVVMDCLISDAMAADQGFEDFCADMGLDTDSRQAERTWKGCLAVSRKLRRLLGPEWDAFMAAERS
jgi:hypothetical protein